jgi:hypothetical protein
MPWCENKECGKTGLKRDEVEFDEENQKVLCKECYEKRQILVPAEEPGTAASWPVTYGIQFTNDGGVRAHVKMGLIGLEFKAPPEELKRFFLS